MATSGSVDFSVSRDNLIEDALRMAGILGIEDSASAGQITWAARILNMMVKNWAGLGPNIWTRKTGWILPQTDTNEIDLGATGDHATLSYTQTTLASAASSGASSIVVSSATGIADTYYIGVEQDDGTVLWTTVSGAPSGTTITLATTLTDDAAADNYVWVYQTKIQRPLKIVEAYHRDEVNDIETSIDVVGKQEYEEMPLKTSEGDALLLAYDALLGDGKAYIWPRFIDGKSAIKIVFQRPFEDFDATADTPDFPQEWYMPLMLNLSVALSPAGGLPVADRQELKKDAAAALGMAQLQDVEEGSFFIRPDDQSR